MASNKIRSCNECETATLVFTSDQENDVEISFRDINWPLSDSENKHLTSDYISDVEIIITQLRHLQLCKRLSVNSLNILMMKENPIHFQTIRTNTFQS